MRIVHLGIPSIYDLSSYSRKQNWYTNNIISVISIQQTLRAPIPVYALSTQNFHQL